MRQQRFNPNFQFVKDPIEFDKFTPRETLQYCLGGLLYMPATRDFRQALIQKKIPGLTSMVLCFEDAVDEKDLPMAEENAVQFLHFVKESRDNGTLDKQDIPLIFFRVRSVEQFNSIADKLDADTISILTGFIFPKFSSQNGLDYFTKLRSLNDKYGIILYAMPILEGREIAYKETRFNELMCVKTLLDCYKDLVLNVRVGGTDFSACFGVRRGIDYTIYDIMPVRDCLLDILNVFARENSYVISGPVWEYFLASKEMKFSQLPDEQFYQSLLTRTPIVNNAVDGLLRELILDKANGFIGKTVIHPTHLPFVNGIQAVTEDEYNDAMQILNTSGGVIKSEKGNKMNEIKPHTNWAKKVCMRADAFGVIKDENSYLELFSSDGV